MKEFGLIGFPLTHSFSKSFFTAKFKNENINAGYSNFEIEDISEINSLINKNKNLCGFNVTIPHKEAILPMLDFVDETAAKIGAVNTVKIKDGKLFGFNTDEYGFRQSLKPFLKLGQEKALILGTGGSSKAVAFVLKSLGLDVLFVSRNPQNFNEISYSEINKKALEFFPIVVNCTPLGTFPNTESFPPIPYEFLNENNLLYDLTYNPELTVFLKWGKEKGATTINGYEMLKLQAERSWEIWNSQA